MQHIAIIEQMTEILQRLIIMFIREGVVMKAKAVPELDKLFNDVVTYKNSDQL